MYIPSGYNATTLFNLMTGNSLSGELRIVFSDGGHSCTLTGDDAISVTVTSSLTDNQAYGIGNFSSKQATMVLLSDSISRVISTLGKYTNIPIAISFRIATNVYIPMGTFYASPSDVISTEGVSCTITAYDSAYNLKGNYVPTITTWPVTPSTLINDIVSQHGSITVASDAYSGLNTALINTAYCLDPTISSQYYEDSIETYTNTFTGNGSATTFILSHEAESVSSCTVGGVATDEYDIDGTSLTFYEAPANGAAISITYTYIYSGNLAYEHEPVTYRQAIAHVAFLMGCNAVFDRNDKLKFIPFVPSSANRTSRMSVTPNHYASLAFSKASNTKSYLGIIDALYQYVDENGEAQTGENIYNSGSQHSNTLTINTVDISTAAITNKFGTAVLGNTGIDYQGYDLSLLYGFPYLDCGDAFTLTDYSNTTYAGLPIFSVTHTYNGSFTSSMSAAATEDEDVEASFSSSYTSKLDAISMNTASANANAVAAQVSADTARSAALTAIEDASIAHRAAISAQADAEAANVAAINAETSADEAKDQSSIANAYANSALGQLEIVQDVVGVLDLLSNNAEYALTEDTEIVPGKWYFTRSGTSPNYSYTVVDNPIAVDLSTYYELVSIDNAVKDYLTSRLSVTSNGLWIQDPNMQTKILLSSTDGVVLYGTEGTIVGKYGATAQVGDSAGFHIEMNGTELGFYQATRKVAYISNNQLYITQSVVLQQMDLGVPVSEGGLGQWSWKVHANNQNPQRNNLNLKWVG